MNDIQSIFAQKRIIALLLLLLVNDFCCGQTSTLGTAPFDLANGTKCVLDTIVNDRSIIMVNGGLQCHACEESLYAFLETLGQSRASICIAYCDIEDNLTRREMKMRALGAVPSLSEVFFIRKQTLLKHLDKNWEWDVPFIILYDKRNGQATVFSGEGLFVDDYQSSTIRHSVQKTIRGFVR